MDDCPSDLHFTACGTGQASPRDQERLAAHIAVCAECRGIAAAFVMAGDEPPAASPAPSEVTSRFDGGARYQPTSDAPLGSGGRGAVYAAFDRELQRPVAIKILWGSRGLGAEARGQLLAEARALGRVSHPNIVALYDVQEWRETAMLVMEQVAGVDLRSWMGARPRSVAEIAAVFGQVARGLAAAHDAGIVHCDVKPENILVGEDHRVRLTDFGLARHHALAASGAADAAGVTAFAPGPWSHTSLGGTPAYVAPELLAGGEPGPASDQFSFAVALHECLHGVRPFSGATATEVMEAIRDDRRGAAPPRRLPGRLRALVERSLSRAPAERHPSMRPIADELERIAGPRRRRVAGIALALGLALATAITGVAVGRRPAPAGGCPAPAVAIDAVWGPPAHVALAARFASGARDDVYLHARLLGGFDAFAERWRAARTACPTTGGAATQSRIAMCLARGATQMRALLALISTPGAGILEPARGSAGVTKPWRDRAPFAVHALPDPQRCIAEPDRGALGDASAPADDVEDVLRALAESDLGAYGASAAAAMQVANRLPVDSHPGLRAEALIIAGIAHGNLSEDAEAERVLLAAVDAGTRARDDDLVARAFIDLLALTARTHPRQASQTLELAEAAVARAGVSPRLESALLVARAGVERQTDQPALAVEHLTRAVALREAFEGLDDLDLVVPLGNLAISTAALGRLAEGLELHKRTLGILERHLPENHPEIARVTNNVAAVAFKLGRVGEAEVGFRRALAMREAALGPRHIKVADALDGLSGVLQETGRTTEGLAVAERALEIRQRALPADHLYVAVARANVASVLITQERCSEALPHLQFAIARFTAVESPLERLAPTVLDRDHCLCRGGRASEGRSSAQVMLARIERTLDGQHRLAADALLEIGLCDLAARRAGDAEPILRRAIAVLEHASVAPSRIARARWPWAKALWQLSRRPEAQAAAEEAERAFRTVGSPVADQIARWLADPRHPTTE